MNPFVSLGRKIIGTPTSPNSPLFDDFDPPPPNIIVVAWFTILAGYRQIHRSLLKWPVDNDYARVEGVVQLDDKPERTHVGRPPYIHRYIVSTVRQRAQGAHQGSTVTTLP